MRFKSVLFSIVLYQLLFFVFSCSNDQERKYRAQKDLVLKKEIKQRSEISKTHSIVGVLKEKFPLTNSKVKHLSQLVKKDNIGKEIISGNPSEARFFTTYLGELIYKGSKLHVFKHYFEVQAAIEKHGHSELIILNQDFAFYYDLEQPENLPNDMKNGLLRYFQLSDTMEMQMEYLTEKDMLLTEKSSE